MTIEEVNRGYGGYEGNILKKCHTRYVGDLYIPQSESCDLWYDWESHIRDLMLAYLKPDDNFIDAGANFGYCTMVAASIIETGHIYSIEPNPFVFSILKENIAFNDIKEKVTPLNVALSDGKSSELDFYWRDGANGNGRSYDPTAYDGNQWYTSSVKNISLDFFLNDKINVIKLDIEGAEFNVLQNSDLFFASNKEVILIIEQHPPYIREQFGNDEYERYMAYLAETFDLIDGTSFVSVLRPK